MITSEEFKRLLAACSDLNAQFPGEVIFIGGIAVYFHSIHIPDVKNLAETTHDADFYISIAAMGDLRDVEEVVPNARLSKHQIMKAGFEFDIYTEHHSKLIIPYSDVAARSSFYGSFRVACLEHLLSLKLEAYENRRASSKGMKDAKDILRICLCAEHVGFQVRNYLPYKMNAHEDLLEEIIKGSATIELAMGNSHIASNYRKIASRILHQIKKASKNK